MYNKGGWGGGGGGVYKTGGRGANEVLPLQKEEGKKCFSHAKGKHNNIFEVKSFHPQKDQSHTSHLTILKRLVLPV